MLISLQKPALPPDGTATEKRDLSPRARGDERAGSLARARHSGNPALTIKLLFNFMIIICNHKSTTY